MKDNEKPLGADAAAVAGAGSIATPQRQAIDFAAYGGPAFPFVFEIPKGSNSLTGDVAKTDERHVVQGMFLRDYFAAKAMNGMASQLLKWNSEVSKAGETLTERAKVMLPELANVAYQLADAMLAEREK